MEPRISSSTMDRTNKIKTFAMLLLLYGICIFPAWDGNLHVLLGLFAVSTILCLVTRGFMPNRFIVDGEKLVIDASFRKTYISIEEILSVRKVDRQDLGIMIRSFGVSWLFGDLGYFSSTAIGHVKVFARRSDNRILITTIRHGNFIIAPPDFITFLRHHIAHNDNQRVT